MRRPLLVLLAVLLTGCTSLGHVPRVVPPAAMTQRTDVLRPSYTDVKELAYQQIDGYLVSGRINRDALYAGALTAGVSVAAMAALSFFAPTSIAMQLIPIGGGLAAGTAAVMQNEPKATIYMRAALLTITVVGHSDERMVWANSSLDTEALCLRRDLATIDARVTEHLLMLNPQHIADRLRAIGPGNAPALQELAGEVANYANLKSLEPTCGKAVPPALEGLPARQ